MRPYSLLIAEDEASFLRQLQQRFTRKGYLVTAVESGTAALDALLKEEYDAAIFDLKMPGIDGIEALERALEIQPWLPVLILTGHGSIKTAIEAIRAGAYDYLTKPCNLLELELILQKALERRALEVENQGLREVLRRQVSDLQIVGKSPAISRLIELTRRVAQTASPVLVEGESGTGKELIARAVHEWSPRAEAAFVPVNTGALPAQLLESELFGHAKGAFTGAVGAKQGLAELADGGTLFLDEIGEMPLELQAKLLRFLESGEVRRVGETRIRRVDVRIVAATNRVLADEARAGRFREDLYYRLNVLSLKVPPLRERPADIPLLVEHFLARMGSSKDLTPEALQLLLAHPFPGNVRELFNLIQRGSILSPDQYIAPEDLGLTPEPSRPGTPGHPATVLAGQGGMAHRELEGTAHRQVEGKGDREPGGAAERQDGVPTLGELEARHIAEVLTLTGWNKPEAAACLGISLRNLYRKIDSLDLKPPEAD